MEKKLRILFEVGFVLVLVGYYIIKVMLPEYRERYGSSDTFLRTKNYHNMYEMKIDQSVHFALVLNDKKQIYHIFFFNKDAKVLYNRGIENHSIEDALHKTISLLVEREYLKEDSIITLIRFGEGNYSEFLTSLYSNLEEYHIEKNVIEKQHSLEQLAQELHVEGNSNTEILRNLDYYSKETIGFLTDEVEKEDMNNLEYSKSVYQKLMNYIEEKNLSSFEKEKPPFPIQMIPADQEGIYPTGNSWYSYQDGKLNAYIEFSKDNERYGYCFQGSIDSYKKGEC